MSLLLMTYSFDLFFFDDLYVEIYHGLILFRIVMLGTLGYFSTKVVFFHGDDGGNFIMKVVV